MPPSQTAEKLSFKRPSDTLTFPKGEGFFSGFR